MDNADTFSKRPVLAFKLDSLDFSSDQGPSPVEIRRANALALDQLVTSGIITPEQRQSIEGCMPARAEFQISKLQTLKTRPTLDEYTQIDLEADDQYFKQYKQQQEASIPPEQTSPDQIARKQAELARHAEKASAVIPFRTVPVPQLPLALNGGCTRDHIIESLKQAGIYHDNLYVRVFRSSDGLQNVLSTGTDCSSNAPMLTTGRDGEDRAMREHGIHDRSKVTFTGLLHLGVVGKMAILNLNLAMQLLSFAVRLLLLCAHHGMNQTVSQTVLVHLLLIQKMLLSLYSMQMLRDKMMDVQQSLILN